MPITKMFEKPEDGGFLGGGDGWSLRDIEF